jgi:hypothetical protein
LQEIGLILPFSGSLNAFKIPSIPLSSRGIELFRTDYVSIDVRSKVLKFNNRGSGWRK